MTDYKDFDLLIERVGEGLYRARVLQAPAGTAKVEFRLPFSPRELEGLLGRIEGPQRGLKLVEPPAVDALQTLGDALFQAVFSGQVGARLEASLARVEERGEGLRLRLRLGEVPELARLPWEVLYDRGIRRFLALFPTTPIVRYLDLPRQERPLPVKPAIRVLVVIASPEGYPRLDVDEEWRQIDDALAGLEQEGKIILERLPRATMPALQRRLRHGPCHVLHFIGHGELDRKRGGAVLILEGEDRQPQPVDGSQLQILLGDRHLRLVVLNACHGGRSAAGDALSGLAQSLVLGNVPAVVAMQFPVSDRGAVTFTRHLYQSLGEGRPVDAAVGEARKAVYLLGTGSSDWSAPVLLMRSPDGRLFDLPPPLRESPPPEPDDPPPRETGIDPDRSDPAGRPPADSDYRSWWWALAALALLAIGIYLAGGLPPFAGATDPGVSPHPPRAAASNPRCPAPPGVEMELVLVEPGSFLMGSSHLDDDAEPVHTVTLNRPFCISAHEVTQSQWRAVLGADADLSTFRGPDQPVERVSWEDAQLFVAALNQQAGGPVFRLPTEAEWEYAVRGGSDTAYSFGDDPEELPRHGNCLSPRGDDRFDRTAPVGSFEPNALGLYDVHGNVWEWVEDFYAPYPEGPVTDPTGPTTGDERVRRGGSYDNRPELCRSATRNHSDPERRDLRNGLRVAREPLPGSPG